MELLCSAGAYGSEAPSELPSSRGCSRSVAADCALPLSVARALDSWTHVILALVTSFHVIAVMSTASKADAIQLGVICIQVVLCKPALHKPSHQVLLAGPWCTA